MKELEIIDPSVGQATKTGLSLRANLSFNQWQDLGAQLRHVEGAVLWWIGDWLNYGERSYGEMYTQALDETDYSYSTLRNAKWVASQIKLSDRSDKLSWTHHQYLCEAPTEARRSLRDRAEVENLTVRQLRDLSRHAKRGISTPQTVPQGKYSVIYADPPWRYEHSISDSRRIENQYPTMELDEICALPVQNLCADDSTLLLWATSPKLEEAMRVISSWGFTYRTCAVWDKEKIGMGYYFRQQHELLLVATRGEPGTPEPSERMSSVIRAKRGEHSKKPEVVYELIESMYPDVPRIELFCRKPRRGWAAWGNEIEDAA